jgi:hypothetical protein
LSAVIGCWDLASADAFHDMPRLIQLDELSFGEPIAYKANMKRHFEHCNGARELSVCGN